jgi:hypothetical protein
MYIKSFGTLVWEALCKTWGGIITFIAFIASIGAFYIIPENTTIELNIILPILICGFFIIVLMSRVAWDAHQNVQTNSPKVIYVKDPPKAYENACALFLLAPNQQLSHDAIVSVFYLEDELERLVGVGRVINVQDDKKVQVLITANYDFGDRLAPIKNNSKKELDKLIVKTSVPSFIMEALRNGG